MISRNAGGIAMGASTMLSRVSTLLNYGYGEELDNDLRSGYTNSETWVKPNLRSSFANLRNTIQEEHIDEETGILNKEGRRYLNRLYENNEEIRNEIINFIRDKRELDHEVILDRRYQTNMLNMTGKKYLAEYITSKDNTKDIIKILARYYL